MCKSLRDDRVNREAADSGEHSIYANGEQSFAVALKPYYAGIPNRSEAVRFGETPGARFCPRQVKTGRQVFDYGFGFDPHPRRLYPKISVAAIRDDLHPQG
jgi:hypothetical protein